MKNQIVASIAALPFALGAAFAGAGAAEAAALVGEFQFSGLGVSQLSEDELNFNPNPTPLFIAEDTAIGSFTEFVGFETLINGAVTFNPFSAPNPFIDFGGGNEFMLKDSFINNVMQSGSNVSIDVALYGTFVSDDGDFSKGAGNITLQLNNTTAAAVQTALDNGDTLSAQFSGAAFTATVPEPTTLFGLGVVATGLVASRRKKNS